MDLSTHEAPRSRAWPRIVPFAVLILLLVAEPQLGEAVEPFWDPRWLYGLRSGVTALALVVLWRHYSELRARPVGRSGALLMSAAVGALVFLLWILLDFPPLVLGEASRPFDPRVGPHIHVGLATTRLAGAALVVPIVEELFWRSFLMRWLERPAFLQVAPRDVGWRPLVISSAVFALEHRLWFAGFLAGLLYGEVYRRTGSLWAAILAHAVTNALLGFYVLATESWMFW